MADIVDRKTRSRMMAGIKGKDTKPEILIRKALHAHGLRYRLHNKALPGKPDLVFAKYNAIIFVNGCFWHGHDCHLFKWPKSNIDFWTKKITRNKEVDQSTLRQLETLGWKVLTIWECSLQGKKKLDFEQLIKETEDWIKHGEASQSISCL